jgi:hypothetical protein
MPFAPFEARDKAIETFHILIQSQTIHLSKMIADDSAAIDVKYLNDLFDGLLALYQRLP